MARKDRIGNRKRSKHKVPEVGYYLVVTDTEATERCFFDGLHDSLPTDMQKKLVIKVVETKTQNLIQKCLEMTAYDAQYRIPWIVFDRDQVVNFDQIIKDAEKVGIHVAGQILALKCGCFRILAICPQSRIHGCAVRDLAIYIKQELVRIIPRPIPICISAYARMETKKKRCP